MRAAQSVWRLFSCALSLALGSCRPDPAAAHLQRELSFFQGFVDPQREAAEVRRVLGQRRLVIDKQIEAPEFIALGAVQPGGPESAVRVITQRGVVLGIDGALDAPLSAFEVSLADGIATSVGELALVGVVQRPRALDTGCLRLFRVLPDGRLSELVLDVSSFGERACVAGIRTLVGRFFATVAWPGLSAVSVPTLAVELRVIPVLLGREDDPRRVLVPAEDGGWLQQARGVMAPERIAGRPEFSLRHGVGVARAALLKVEGRGTDAQRAAYLSALLPARAGSPEAAVVADTVSHIERGWLDSEPANEVAPEGSGGLAEAPSGDGLVVEPAPTAGAPEAPAGELADPSVDGVLADAGIAE